MSNDVTRENIIADMSKSISLAFEMRSTFCMLSAAMSGRESQTELNKSRPDDNDFINVVEGAAEKASSLIELLDKVDCDYQSLVKELEAKAVKS